MDKTRLTQVGRALARLGIEHIAAYSPEARGRSERAFRTLQDRLVPRIPPSPLRPHYVKAKVRVHRYPDDSLAIFHGPRRLARYRADGTLIEQNSMKRAA